MGNHLQRCRERRDLLIGYGFPCQSGLLDRLRRSTHIDRPEVVGDATHLVRCAAYL